MTGYLTDNTDQRDPEVTRPGDPLHGVMRVFRIAEYRQQTVLGVLVACLAVGAAYYTFAPRYFRSDARLMVIEQRGANVAGIADQAGSDELLSAHRELVSSPVVIRQAIESLAPEHRIDLIHEPPERWVETISEGLYATNVRKTNVIRVGYSSREPEAAAAVVRAVIDSYLTFVEKNHRGAAAEVLDRLTADRDALEETLLEKQALLRAERERMGNLDLPEARGVVDPVINRAIQLNTALMETQQRRVGLQASLATFRAARASGGDLRQYVGLVQETVGEHVLLAAMGLGPNDLEVLATQQGRVLEIKAEIERLRPYYGPNHSHMLALGRQLTDAQRFVADYHNRGVGRPEDLPAQTLGPMLEGMLTQALSQVGEEERQLEDAFRRARSEAARQSGELARVEMLEREVERQERLYDVLFQRIAAVDIHKVQAPIRATIVQEPLPADRPSSPRVRSVLTMSLLGGLALGIAIACLQDMADDRFPSPDEMSRQLGCRVLAVVRSLAPSQGVALDAVQIHAQPQSPDSEAFRTLRTSIALGADGADRLIVSSAEPGDGKTTIASNLAVAYAQSGKRVLLIDADLRKPGLTALFDLKGAAGLTDLLCGPDDLSSLSAQCVHPTSASNLDLIPAGPRRPDPAELLMGPAFGELLAWADARYDHVLIDCPPVLAVSDAQIVGRLVDGCVLVVSPEKNHRALVTRAVHSFAAGGVPLVGLVANRVSEQNGRGFSFGYDYGYGHEEEPRLEDHGPHARAA